MMFSRRCSAYGRRLIKETKYFECQTPTTQVGRTNFIQNKQHLESNGFGLLSRRNRTISTSAVLNFPTVYCTTNMKDQEIPDGFEKRLSDVIIETLDKQDAGCSLVVATNARMCMNGSTSTSCLLEIKSIDRFNGETCPKYTPVFRDFITSELKLPDDSSTSAVHNFPTVYCTTNLKDQEIPDGFEKRLSDIIIETLDKKDAGCSLVVATNARMCMNGSTSTSCLLEIKSIDRFNGETCPKYTPVFRDFITSELTLPDDRIYLIYTPMEKWQSGKRQTK